MAFKGPSKSFSLANDSISFSSKFLNARPKLEDVLFALKTIWSLVHSPLFWLHHHHQLWCHAKINTWKVLSSCLLDTGSVLYTHTHTCKAQVHHFFYISTELLKIEAISSIARLLFFKWKRITHHDNDFDDDGATFHGWSRKLPFRKR